MKWKSQINKHLKKYEEIQNKKTQISETSSVTNLSTTIKQKFVVGDRVVPKYKKSVAYGKALGYYAQVIGVDFIGGDIYYKLDSGEVVHELDLYTISQSNSKLISSLYNKLEELRENL